MPPRKKNARRNANVAPQEPVEPRPDPPFVAWKKQQEANGMTRVRLVGVTDTPPAIWTPCSSSAGPSPTGLGNISGAEDDAPTDGADEGESDDDSYCDSDGYTAADVVDDTAEDGTDVRADKGKRKVGTTPTKKQHWTEDELTELAAAMWMAKEDWDHLKGKQGAQPWKKIRRVIRIANPAWRRPSDAMAKQWMRLKNRLEEIGVAEGGTGGEPQQRPEWFEYVYNWWYANRAPDPHVVDEGGARNANAEPTAVRAAPAPPTEEPEQRHMHHNMLTYLPTMSPSYVSPLRLPPTSPLYVSPYVSPLRLPLRLPSASPLYVYPLPAGPLPTIPVRRRAMESPAYAGHLLVADTITRLMTERNNRQDAAFERLISVIERLAPQPPRDELLPTPVPTTPGSHVGTPPSGGGVVTGAPTAAGPSLPPGFVMAPTWFSGRQVPTSQAVTPGTFAVPANRPTAPILATASAMSAPSHGAEPAAARQMYADASFLSNTPSPIAVDGNGQWYFTGVQQDQQPPRGA
ncbi:unnamed protein product [Closterium sp. Yama58-4]|nr:unnamed protein product [Closterium sp. Yama58-4]